MEEKLKNIPAVKGKRLTGKVVTISNEHMIVVEVVRVWRHPIYKKAMRRSHKYSVHVQGVTPLKDEIVRIAPCRPVSKTKHYLLLNS